MGKIIIPRDWSSYAKNYRDFINDILTGASYTIKYPEPLIYLTHHSLELTFKQTIYSDEHNKGILKSKSRMSHNLEVLFKEIININKLTTKEIKQIEETILSLDHHNEFGRYPFDSKVFDQKQERV